MFPPPVNHLPKSDVPSEDRLETGPPPEVNPWQNLKNYRKNNGGKIWTKESRTRSMRVRLRQLIEAPAKGMRFATEIAARLGVEPESIDTMDLGDLIALTGVMHAVRGKAQFYSEVIQRIDGKPGSSFVDNAVEDSGPKSLEDERSMAIRLYRSIISDPNASVRDKLDAQSALNTVLGLVNTDTTTVRERADAMLAAMRSTEEF